MLDLKTIFPEKIAKSCMIDKVYYNSQQVTPNSLFVALKGEKADGHRYLQDAFDNGAIVALVEEVDDTVSGMQIKVADTHLALADVSYRLYPQIKPMLFVGVTGTDGKTSTTVILKQLLEKLGKKVGYIGTNGIEYADVSLNLNCTTPLAPELFEILADMSEKGVEIVSMEVSSHGLATKRVANILFDYGVFTNFSRDHLDFHKTIAEYKAAKLQLFAQLSATGKAIINLDDAEAKTFIQQAMPHEIMTYSLNEQAATFYADDISYKTNGMEFMLHDMLMETKLLGAFNIYNILVAIAIATDLGYDLSTIKTALAEITAIPGRMELFYQPKRKFSAVVDFGHAPNAIKNVLQVCRKMTSGRLTIITGAVGDGDKAKRPLMAENAVKYADKIIFTTDQPYSEDPRAIINEMVENLPPDCYQIILDREQAIKQALDEATENEIVVVMGKGRETQIKYKDYSIEFSDYAFVKSYMEA